MIVVDSSVVFKWLVHEESPDASNASSLRNRFIYQEFKVVVPNLLLYEISNIFVWKTSLSPTDVENVWAKFKSLKLSFIEPTVQFVEKCLNIAQKYQLTIYDCSYIVLAQDYGCDMVTADKKLVRQVNLSYVKLLSEYNA